MLGGVLQNSTLLVIHTILRPLLYDKRLKWDDPLSLHKLLLEGQIAKRKTCLSWDIQTFSLRVFLPREKETAWVQDIIASLTLIEINIENL